MEAKRSLSKKMRSGIVAAAVAAGTLLVLPAAPAQAAGNGQCTFGPSGYGCSTGTVTPNSNLQIEFTARAWFGRVTCRAHDAHNGITVGEVTTATPGAVKRKTVGGLYGSYFLVCAGSNSKGEGKIAG